MGKSWDKGGWGERGNSEPDIYRKLRGRFGNPDDLQMTPEGEFRMGDDVWPGYHAEVETVDTGNGPELRFVRGGATGYDPQSRISSEMGKKGEMPDFRVYYTNNGGEQSEFIAAETAARIAAAARRAADISPDGLESVRGGRWQSDEERYWEDFFEMKTHTLRKKRKPYSADDPAIRRMRKRAEARDRKVQAKKHPSQNIIDKMERVGAYWDPQKMAWYQYDASGRVQKYLSDRESIAVFRAARIQPLNFELRTEKSPARSFTKVIGAKIAGIFRSNPKQSEAKEPAAEITPEKARFLFLKRACEMLAAGGSYKEVVQFLGRSKFVKNQLQIVQTHLRHGQFKKPDVVTSDGSVDRRYFSMHLEDEYGNPCSRVLVPLSRKNGIYMQGTRKMIAEYLRGEYKKADQIHTFMVQNPEELAAYRGSKRVA